MYSEQNEYAKTKKKYAATLVRFFFKLTGEGLKKKQ